MPCLLYVNCDTVVFGISGKCVCTSSLIETYDKVEAEDKWIQDDYPKYVCNYST